MDNQKDKSSIQSQNERTKKNTDDSTVIQVAIVPIQQYLAKDLESIEKRLQDNLEKDLNPDKE